MVIVLNWQLQLGRSIPKHQQDCLRPTIFPKSQPQGDVCCGKWLLSSWRNMWVRELHLVVANANNSIPAWINRPGEFNFIHTVVDLKKHMTQCWYHFIFPNTKRSIKAKADLTHNSHTTQQLPLLLTWINFNNRMDTYFHPLWIVEWNYLSILKVILSRTLLGMW